MCCTTRIKYVGLFYAQLASLNHSANEFSCLLKLWHSNYNCNLTVENKWKIYFPRYVHMASNSLVPPQFVEQLFVERLFIER
jgi:hypothetical protein